MTKFVPAWYLLYTKPKHERKVAEQLDRKNISLYLPMMKVARKWHDRTKIIDMPMFPSYIFVKLHNLEDYFYALHCDGTVRYVTDCKSSARVREEVIENLRLVVDRGIDIEVYPDNFNAGQRCMINEGIFGGIECEVVEYKNEQKVIVRIDLLHRSVLATLPCMSLVHS
ncbi:UpxY family transcription antiterminator [Chitinophaga sp. HK235]|uniref:UpxY family transcription antiterminator n=1 Tax=Chitinophaga sp. HK235 TaxID=2952571 RepID=UPI001BA901C4|nr:UpxY family transcription antiterminator [Chitinophaga sp. HK235]